MIHLSFLGDLYYVQGKKQSGFLLANMSLEEIRGFTVFVHGAGRSGFEALTLLESRGITVSGITDNDPALAGTFLGGRIISTPPIKDCFIVAAVPYSSLWAFRAQMKVLGAENWGVFISPAFYLSPRNNGQRAFDAILSTLDEMMNDTTAFGKERFEEFIKFDPPYHYGDAERFFHSICYSSSVLKWIDTEIPSSTENMKLLDIGPGFGILSRFSKKLKPLLRIEWLTLSEPHRRVEKVCAYDNNSIPEKQHFGIIEDPEFTLGEQFDFIILTEVFEHFAANPVDVMKNIQRLLKEDGRIFFSTPNWGPLWIYRSWREMRAFDEFADNTQYSDYLFPHTYQFSEGELREVLTEAGLKIIKYEQNPNNHHCAFLEKR